MNLKRFDKKMQEEKQTPVSTIINGIAEMETKGDTVTIFLSGKIDANNFEEIQNKAFYLITAEGIHNFIFDMNDVNYVSSAGLRMFSAVNHKSAELEISYKLVKMREDILKLFQMTGYASAFCIELKED